MSRLSGKLIPHLLHFIQPAGTSRGVYHTRKIWYVLLQEEDDNGKVLHYGVGECAPLPDLSLDALEDSEYQSILDDFVQDTVATCDLPYHAMRDYPSMLFGLETALLALNSAREQQVLSTVQLFDNAFTKGERGIQINGLIWMGSFEEMYQRIEQKIAQGFKCIKLKIGAIDFERELELLTHIRKHFSREQIELRVDANGAFSVEEAMDKLKRLAKLDLHSIEQPIKQGQYQELKALCAHSPLPIALDEELIGVNHRQDKVALLDFVRPQYIILKPSLHGGMSGCKEWIDLAKQRQIGVWITSALESNVGLNAIAQWCSSLLPEVLEPMPQGLGTGLLFSDNISYPLEIKGECLHFDPKGKVDFMAYLQAQQQLQQGY